MFSVFCKNLQTCVGHILVKCYSASSDTWIIATKLCHHFDNSIYVKMHAQDICTNLTNLHNGIWKGTFQAIGNHWKSQWLLIDKITTLTDQESNADYESMLCNTIHSNPDFLQLEHLDKLRQAQGNSNITYHNHLTLLHTAVFQLNLKSPKHLMHHIEVNSTNSTPNNSKSSGHVGCGCSQHNNCEG